jgi:alanyl-tRNA synthetase
MIAEQELKELKRKQKILSQAAEILRVQEADLPRVVGRFLKEIKEFEEKLSQSKN